MRSDGDQGCVEPIIEELVKVVDARVQTQVDSQINDVGDLTLDDVRRQSVLRNADSQHSASNG